MPTPDAAVEAAAAIRQGNLPVLRALLADDPGLATARLGGRERWRTGLHVVTDWPGFTPNGPQVAQLLVDAGAQVDARRRDGTGETPLHWAASSDDADVARVLVDAGADVDAPGGSIGTVLDNAELLLQRGADPGSTPDYGNGTVLDVARSHGAQRLALIGWLESIGARRRGPGRLRRARGLTARP